MMNEKKHSPAAFRTTISLLLFWLVLSALLIALVGWLISGQRMAAYVLFNGIVLLVVLAFAIMMLVSLYSFFRIWYNKGVPVLMLQGTKSSLKWIYPLLKLAGKLMKRDKDDVRKAFTLLNNRLMMSDSKKIQGGRYSSADTPLPAKSPLRHQSHQRRGTLPGMRSVQRGRFKIFAANLRRSVRRGYRRNPGETTD